LVALVLQKAPLSFLIYPPDRLLDAPPHNSVGTT